MTPERTPPPFFPWFVNPNPPSSLPNTHKSSKWQVISQPQWLGCRIIGDLFFGEVLSRALEKIDQIASQEGKVERIFQAVVFFRGQTGHLKLRGGGND